MAEDGKITIPLAVDLTQRSIGSGEDSYILNGYIETHNGKKYVRKRPGLDGDHPADAGVAAYNSMSAAIYYARYDNNVYYLHDAGATANLMQWVSVGSTPTDKGSCGADADYGWDDAVMMKEVSHAGVTKLFVKGASRWALYNFSATITLGTGSGYPSVTGQGLGFLDGYVFVHDGVSIFNCTNEDPTAWSASNYITPSRMADKIVYISDYKQHIVAFCQGSIEFFYNDDDNATGSPLTSRSDLAYRVGVPSTPVALPVVWQDQNTDYIAFIAIEGSKRYVAELDGFSIKKISNQAIDQILNGADFLASETSLGGFSVRGKRFVKLMVLNSAGSPYYYVYDTEEGKWHEWTFALLGATLPLIQSCPIQSLTGNAPMLTATTDFQGNIRIFDPDTYRDIEYDASTSTPEFRVQTDRIYSSDAVFMSDFRLFGDKDKNTTFNIQWTDDDYQNFNTATSLNFSSAFTKIAPLGRFQDRAFRISFSGNSDVRLSHATARVE